MGDTRDVVERLRHLDYDAGDVIEAAMDRVHRDALTEAADTIEALCAELTLLSTTASAPADPRPLECSVCGAGYIGSRAGEECGVEGCDGRLYFVVAETAETGERDENLLEGVFHAGYVASAYHRPYNGEYDAGYRAGWSEFRNDPPHWFRSPAPTAAEPERKWTDKDMEANVAVAVAAVTQHYEDKLRELQAEPEREALLREPDLWQVQIEGDAEVDAFTTKAEAEEWAASELDTLREGGVEEDGDTEYAGPSVKVYPVWIGSPLRALATPEVK